MRVYQLSEELSDNVWSIVTQWDSFARDTIGKQLARSCDSIGANIAEGEGLGSYQDNRRFIRIARGSLQETQHWLRRAFKRSLLNDSEVQRIKPIVDRLAPTRNAYLRSIGGTNERVPRTKDKGPRTKDEEQ
ncbi:MAG: four helix bundle protein [Acidobacteriota bacterium]